MKKRDTPYYVAFYAPNYNGIRQRFEFKVDNQRAANALAKRFKVPSYYFGIKGVFSAQYPTSQSIG